MTAIHRASEDYLVALAGVKRGDYGPLSARLNILDSLICVKPLVEGQGWQS